MYKEYQQLYERKLETFIKSQGIDDKQFQEMCEAALVGPSEDEGGHREFIELLLASFDYNKFLGLMVHSVKMAKQAGILKDSPRVHK